MSGGGAQICQAHVNHHQRNAGHDTGSGHDPGLICRFGVPFVPGAFQNDDAEHHSGQNVHGLIPGLNAGLGDIFYQRSGRDGADGIDNSHDDEDQQADQQTGSEDLSHNIHHRGLPDAQQQDQRKKQRGEQHGAEARHQRADGHLVGAGCRSGNGQHGTDTKHDRTHQQCGGDPPDPARDALGAAAVENGKQCDQCQADVGDIVADKAQDPLGAGFQPQVGRENDVAGTEKHGKQGKTDDKYIALSRVLHETPPCSVPAEVRFGEESDPMAAPLSANGMDYAK